MPDRHSARFRARSRPRRSRIWIEWCDPEADGGYARSPRSTATPELQRKCRDDEADRRPRSVPQPVAQAYSCRSSRLICASQNCTRLRCTEAHNCGINPNERAEALGGRAELSWIGARQLWRSRFLCESWRTKSSAAIFRIWAASPSRCISSRIIVRPCRIVERTREVRK